MIFSHFNLTKISFYTALPNCLKFFAFTVLKCLRLSADPVTLKIKRGKALFVFLASLHQHFSERDKNINYHINISPTITTKHLQKYHIL